MALNETLDNKEMIRITKRNREEYKRFLDADALQNIGRAYFRGLLIEGASDEPEAAMIWEYHAIDGEEDPVSEIAWFHAANEAAAEQLLSGYATEIEKREIFRSRFEFPHLSKDEEAAFLQAGFRLAEKKSGNIVTTVGELSALSLLSKKAPSGIVSLSEIDEEQFHTGVTSCLFYERKGMLEDLAFLPKDWFENEVSSCLLRKDRVKGFLLVHRAASGMLIADLLFSVGVWELFYDLQLIRHSVQAAARLYPPETKVLLRRHDVRTARLMRLLFPRRQGETVTVGRKD